MEKKRLEKLKTDHLFSLGFLTYYKEIELGSAIGDDSEGKSTRVLQIGSYILNSENPRNSAFESAFRYGQSGIVLDNCSNVSITNTTIVQEVVDTNYYILCSCAVNDDSVKKEFGGSTLIIEDVPRFLYCLNKKLATQGIIAVAAGPCAYIKNRTERYTEQENSYMLNAPFFVKDSRYSYQREFRMVWRRRDGKPIVKRYNFDCREALKCCSFDLCD